MYLFMLVLGRLLVWSSIRSSRHARPTVDHAKEWSTENEYNELALVCPKAKILHNESNLPRRQPSYLAKYLPWNENKLTFMLLLLLFPHLHLRSASSLWTTWLTAHCACTYSITSGGPAPLLNCPDMVDHGRVSVGSFCRLLDHDIFNDSEH